MSIKHAKATAVVREADWNADHVITDVVLAAMTPGGVSGVYAGTQTLVRTFQAAPGAGGQSAGLNVFIGGAGNSTMTNGAGEVRLASGNIAIGYRSLYVNTTGFDNAAIGVVSLWANTTGYANIAVGSYALFLNTTGYYNVAIGYGGLYANTTGSSNSAVGNSAGRFDADGATALIDPENSVYIGALTRGFDNSDNNTIVIGYSAIGAGANKAVIGNASLTDVYLGSSAGLAILHAATLALAAGAVTYGANDSGGAGYRTLLVPNA